MIQPIFGLVIITGLLAIMFTLFLYPLPENAKEVILMLIGVLSKSFSDVVNYYFGSTSASRQKDKTIANMANNHPQQ